MARQEHEIQNTNFCFLLPDSGRSAHLREAARQPGSRPDAEHDYTVVCRGLHVRYGQRRQQRISVSGSLPTLRPQRLPVSFVNFECTLTNAAQTADKQWHFKGDARYAAIFPAGSVEAVGLSNNHSHDYLKAGFNDTAASFRKAHVPVFYQNAPYVTTLHGIQTVIIGDCTVVGENTTRIDGAPERVLREIKQYKKPGNIVLVVMHWGSELAAAPFAWQQAMGHGFIDAGADAVIGHHPHIVQGIERYHGKYIAYSLGNFAFGGNSLARFPQTFIFQLQCRITGGRRGVLEASIVPCLTTSSRARNSAGVLRNNYQPAPVFGGAADQIIKLVLKRSAGLRYGVRRLQ